MPLIRWIQTSFFSDRDSWILWVPVFFGLGIIFYFNNPSAAYLLPFLLFSFLIFLIFLFKKELWKLPLIAAAFFILGFLWTKFYTQTIAHTPKIEYKLYATAIGRVDDINSFYNPILKRNSYQITLRDISLYKAGSISGDVVKKKENSQKVKKYKKKKVKKEKKKRERKKKIKEEKVDEATTNKDQNVDINSEEKPKKKRGRKKKIKEKNLDQLKEVGDSGLQNQEDSIANNKDISNTNPEVSTQEKQASGAEIHSDIDEEIKPKKRRRRRKKSQEDVKEETANQGQEVDQNQIALDLEKSIAEKPVKKPKKLKSQKVKKPKKVKAKKSKKENKTVIKNYINVAFYQEIDREFLAIDYKSQNQKWDGNRYKEAPSKIIFSVNTKLNDAKIGDIIQTRVVLEPFKPPYFPNGYDKGFENYFKGIGGSGYAASDLKVLKARNENSFLSDIKILRQNIARKILDQMDEQGGTMAVALLVGSQNLISPEVMQSMRNSGLAHIISISGLHFTLAAGILFFCIRFLLSLNQYLVLNYDIKKIAAALAIAAGFFYLLLADTPIPAVRSFIVIALIFSAILLDLKPDAFRSTAFAALAILIFSPNVIFSVSFQLSFAAILALIALADLTKKYHINSSDRPLYIKFFFYLFGIILSSIAATIATTPFSIYHFNNFISFGALANLAAIPITSFVIMPCGFLALFLMPFGFEKLALYPMQISIGWIIDIANYVAAMPNAYLVVKAISPASFGLITFGGLWILLWKKTWRILGFAPIILGVYFAYQTQNPNLLIDSEKKLVAFYSEDKLIFLKPVKSKQAMVWAKKLGLDKFENIDELSEEEKQIFDLNCDKNFCQFKIKEKRILVLNGRNKIDEICQKQSADKYDIMVNIGKKYQTPKCFESSEVIDNRDFNNKKNYFLKI